MRKTNILMLAGLAAIFVLGLNSTRTPANDPDPILESFERELNHEPSPAPRVRRYDILEDELYGAINPIHWTQNDEQDFEAEESAEGPEHELHDQ